ncbi:hypothetical protein SAMN05421881_102211 [Nitrosomonas halophila]|uniref:EpsG family protein n=2 Tax=Nitrosomonas halophila TaxID=44576 RepID=A0A1H3HWC8_9PROT|nr:hypothetical protein SAMN05421881_102211 [Nitrosomonas halophila]
MRVNRTCLQYACMLIFVAAMLSVPWEALRGEAFRDKQVYYEYFLYGKLILEFREFESVIDYFIHEFLWHFSVHFLVHELEIPLDYIFLAISAFLLTVFSLYLVKQHGTLSLLLLINPLVIDLAFSQFRSALAIACLGAAFLVRRSSLAYAFAGIALLFHTAASIFIVINACVHFGQRYMARHGKSGLGAIGFFVGLGVFVSLLIGPLREIILALLGDRRVHYPDQSSTFLYISFWSGLLIALILHAKKHALSKAQSISAVILSLVTTNLFTGGYSTRFLATMFPFLVSSVLTIDRGIKPLILTAFVAYTALQWLFWLNVI